MRPDVGEFYALWQDRDPDPGWIVQHHPGVWDSGVWDISLMYEHFVHGLETGVESGPLDFGPLAVKSLYPNPATTRYVVARVGGSGSGGGRVSIYSVGGRLVRKTKTPGRFVRLDLDGLSTGIYFVRFEPDQGPVGAARKLVVVH